MPDEFRSVSDIFNNDKTFEKLRQVALENDVLDKYSEIFPELNKISNPVKVQNGILFLRVENSVWKHELNIRRELLIDRINKYFNSKIITSIKFFN